jgi:ATP-dependent exoDNAse (exonuclease V) beta subunit
MRGPACLPDPSDLDDVAQMLDLLEAEAQAQTGGGHIADLAQLDARVAKLFAGNRTLDDCGPVVQIMTIHKAKGLEFDTVILPGLHRVPRSDERRLLAWAELRIQGSRRHELLVAPIRETGADEETDDDAENIYRHVQRQQREKQREEEVRLLYVAATRAKCRLHLLGSAAVKSVEGESRLAAPRAGSLLASLWPAVEPVFAEAMVAPLAEVPPIRPGKVAVAVARRAVRLVPSQALPQVPATIAAGGGRKSATGNAPIDFEWAGETARHVGTLVHAFLQCIAREGAAGWNTGRVARSRDNFAAELRRLGVAAGELSAATRRVSEALNNTLDDARGRWVLAAHQSANSEWRLSGILDHEVVNVVIDRTFVDPEGIRWIIDFKTGDHEGANAEAFLDNEQNRYREQLETYAKLLQGMNAATPPQPIKLGLYFPLLTGWREWEWQPG